MDSFDSAGTALKHINLYTLQHTRYIVLCMPYIISPPSRLTHSYVRVLYRLSSGSMMLLTITFKIRIIFNKTFEGKLRAVF